MPIHTCPHCRCEYDARNALRRRSKKTQPLKTKAPQTVLATTRVWRCMRQLRSFTAPDLMATAEATARAVDRLTRALVGVGYVRVVRKSSGEVGDYTAYRLLRDTGPHAPRIRADGRVWDVNLQQEVTRAAD